MILFRFYPGFIKELGPPGTSWGFTKPSWDFLSLSKTPEVFDLEFVSKRFPTSYDESMNTVLFQECVRYNAMLAEMKVSLIQVQRALLGEVVMDEMLD